MTIGTMPNVEKTPRRTFRAGEEWEQAQAVAAERGDNLSEILRDALKRYVKKNGNGVASGDGGPRCELCGTFTSFINQGGQWLCSTHAPTKH